MKKLIYVFMFAFVITALYSCGSSRHSQRIPTTTEKEVSFNVINSISRKSYSGLDYGVNIDVIDKRQNQYICSYRKKRGDVVNYKTSTSLADYISECVSRGMNDMGFNVYVESTQNYNLRIYILDSSNAKNNYNVSFVVELYNPAGKCIYSTTITNGVRYRFSAFTLDNLLVSYPASLKDVLKNVNWDLIASNLKRAVRPAQDVYAQVQGYGDTALESTIIRWYIVSAPAGADVQWRVVSSTPDVKNTNQSFLGSTPYESTESFDVIGLTYNNSGNVQIEISCEKPGYITQRKRFNVRQAIDQKEISTKFNLVKED